MSDNRLVTLGSRSPEVVPYLRALFRGMPSVVYRALMTTNLQRSGCALCGIGPHSTYDRPHMDTKVAEEKAAALYRRCLALAASRRGAAYVCQVFELSII